MREIEIDKLAAPELFALRLAQAEAGACSAADDSLSRTTREFYHTNQRMAKKADAMSAWRDALLNAYVKAGGKPPRPAEG